VHRVFVFGTLKEGFPNFHKNQGARVGGEFHTAERYPLYLVGERYSPWLVLSPGIGHQISGQVFEASDSALAEMDLLERVHAPDGYRRETIEVVCQQSAQVSAVMVYGKPVQMLSVAEIKETLAGEYSLAHAALYQSR